MPSSILAAHAGIRQVEAVLKAEAASARVDKAVLAVWRDILALLTKPLGPASAYHRAHEIMGRLHAAAALSISDSLTRIVHWGHKSAKAAILKSVPVDRLIPRLTESRLQEDFARPLPGAVHLAIDRLGLGATDVLAPLREPVAADLTDAQKREMVAGILFPPPSEDTVRRIVYGPLNGQTWMERLSDATRLASPDQIATLIMNGYAAGKTQREIAKDILPAVQGVKASARRIARTYGMHVAGQIQMDAYRGLGDLVIGYQVHATLDLVTRPWHASRHGQTYYTNPRPGQKGMRQMPHPPVEPEDPTERPVGEPQVAPNCR